MFKKNNPGCPCCTACTIFADTFDRADASSIGAEWDERAGNWAISTNAAVPDAANAVAVVDEDHPEATSDMVAYAVVTGNTSGDMIRVIVAWEDDSNYLFGQLRLTGASSAASRLGKVEAGVLSYLTSETTTSAGGVDETFTIKVCYVGDRLSLELRSGDIASGGTFLNAHGFDVTYTGLRAGIGAGTMTGTIRFLRFAWEYHASEERPLCRGCAEPCEACEDGTTPYAVQVEIDGVADGGACADCLGINGMVYVLRIESPCNYTQNAGDACAVHLLQVGLCNVYPAGPGIKEFSLTILTGGVTVTAYGNAADNCTYDGLPANRVDCEFPAEVVAITDPIPATCDWSAATAEVTMLV